jgi:hypothetical protein
LTEMKVFVNNVDLPLGRSISRLLAYTQIGSRLATEDDDSNQQQQQSGEPGSAEAAPAQPTIETYQVVGTLSKSASAPISEDDNEDGFFELDFSKEVAALAVPTASAPAAKEAAASATATATGGKAKAPVGSAPGHQAVSASASAPVAGAHASARILASKKGVIPIPDFYQKGTHKPDWVSSAFPFCSTMV